MSVELLLWCFLSFFALIHLNIKKSIAWIFFKNSPLVLLGRKTIIGVWDNMRVSNIDRFFWLNYRLKVFLFVIGVSLSGIVWNVCTSVCVQEFSSGSFVQIVLLLFCKPKTVWVLSYLHGNEYKTTVGMRKVWGCIAVWIFFFVFFLLAYHHGATHIYSPVLSQLCACHKHIPNGWQISCWEGHKLQPGQTSLNQTLLQRKLRGKTLNERADLEEEVSRSVFRLFLNKVKVGCVC